LATNELNKLGIPFDFAKPSAFIQFLANICTEQNDIILDFFSGSGTTAHAVMQQNATDGGHRRFILVQLPETTDEKSEAYKSGYKTICDIGRERIRRAGTKIVSDTGQTDLDIGFRALRIDSSNMSDGIMSTPGQTVQSDLLSRVDNIKQGRSPLDLLFGVMIECGISLDSGILTKTHHGQTYYSVNNGELIACFDNELCPELICEIAHQKPMCAVFRDSSFADAKDKINVSEIFKNFCGDDKCLRIL
jgi:adenine-specific DNA-methyltransferase